MRTQNRLSDFTRQNPLHICLVSSCKDFLDFSRGEEPQISPVTSWAKQCSDRNSPQQKRNLGALHKTITREITKTKHHFLPLSAGKHNMKKLNNFLRKYVLRFEEEKNQHSAVPHYDNFFLFVLIISVMHFDQRNTKEKTNRRRLLVPWDFCWLASLGKGSTSSAQLWGLWLEQKPRKSHHSRVPRAWVFDSVHHDRTNLELPAAPRFRKKTRCCCHARRNHVQTKRHRWISWSDDQNPLSNCLVALRLRCHMVNSLLDWTFFSNDIVTSKWFFFHSGFPSTSAQEFCFDSWKTFDFTSVTSAEVWSHLVNLQQRQVAICWECNHQGEGTANFKPEQPPILKPEWWVVLILVTPQKRVGVVRISLHHARKHGHSRIHFWKKDVGKFFLLSLGSFLWRKKRSLHLIHAQTPEPLKCQTEQIPQTELKQGGVETVKTLCFRSWRFSVLSDRAVFPLGYVGGIPSDLNRAIHVSYSLESISDSDSCQRNLHSENEWHYQTTGLFPCVQTSSRNFASRRHLHLSMKLSNAGKLIFTQEDREEVQKHVTRVTSDSLNLPLGIKTK